MLQLSDSHILILPINLNSVCENLCKSTYQRWKLLNRPIPNFYNSIDANVIATKVQFTKTRPTSFYKKQYQQLWMKFWKLNVKNRSGSVCMAYSKLNCKFLSVRNTFQYVKNVFFLDFYRIPDFCSTVLAFQTFIK